MGRKSDEGVGRGIGDHREGRWDIGRVRYGGGKRREKEIVNRGYRKGRGSCLYTRQCRKNKRARVGWEEHEGEREGEEGREEREN